MKKKHSVIDLLFTLTLFCVFSASALVVVMIGANVYKSTVAGMNENYGTRTAIAYVSEKVRESDTSGAVELVELAGTTALALTRGENDAAYTTYIYYADGALRELFVQGAAVPELAAGQPVALLSGASFAPVRDGLYRFTAAGDAGEEALLFALHSAG